MAFGPTLLSLLALACEPSPDTSDSHVSDSETGGADTGRVEPVDEDGDGFYDLATAAEPALVDCDDHDPVVTPFTERFVPPGLFLRGQDGDAYADPQREIFLSGYCIQVTEVTVEAFVPFLQALLDSGQAEVIDGFVYDLDGVMLYDIEDAEGDDVIEEWITWDGEIFAPFPDHERFPVAEVTWSGADAYCRSVGLALPTEAQWEKAARGGCELAGDPSLCEPGLDDRDYPWGDLPPSCDLANYGVPIGDQGDTCMGGPVEVGLYPDGASPYGLLDMAGNEMEWTADWFQVDSYADDAAEDPLGPDDGFRTDPDGEREEDVKAARGGCWLLGPDDTRTWARRAEFFTGNSNSIGLRCARPSLD